MPIIRKQDLPLIGSSYKFVRTDHNVAILMFLLEAQPKREAPLHRHDYDEIILVQEGHSRLVIGELSREAMAGNIIVFKAGTPHGFCECRGEPVEAGRYTPEPAISTRRRGAD
jgi:quercetin dioxygenase-like cupin family protein